jgi:DNA polymerase III delta prime subunit
MIEEYIWTEKYRPTSIEDCILPVALKKEFQEFVKSKNIPDLLLCGNSGLGKTTVAKAMLEEIGADYIFINASMNGSIDTLRNEIQNFASTVSFSGGRKYVILDESDAISRIFQDSLRGFVEEFASTCSFILTCNFPNKIIDALHSRCSRFDFIIPGEEKEKIALKFYRRVQMILEKEKVEYDSGTVVSLITHYFPDFRRTINELQRYSISGKIDSGILANLRDESIDTLIGYLKDKNFKEVRKWTAEQTSDSSVIFRQLYDEADSFLKSDSIPQLILYIAKYQESAAIVADSEINLVAFFVECMCDLSFL